MNIQRLNEVRYSFKLYRNYCSILNEKRVADFPTAYVTEGVEQHWNDVWQRNNYFTPKKGPVHLKMILPPPNITGVLHLGHALTVTIQDVLARWHRMKGDSVLWIPGLDHAGIATQVAVEKHLFATKGVTRYDLGKEEFLACIEEWKNQKGDTIKNQLKSLGASLDWSKEYFTMSKEHNNAVIEAFLTLNERNLLYRKNGLVNWCPALRSTISDIEVEFQEVTKKTDLQIPNYDRKIPFGQIVEVGYKLKDSKEEIIVATTRVESMPGDVAIAVHPEDLRFSRYIGQQVWHPLRQTYIPIIQDSSVQQDFGTGAVKITPAHNHLDFEIATKNNLELIQVIGEDGRINENIKNYGGLPRFIARKKILDDLTNTGALKAIKDHPMSIPVCSRSGDVIEYLMKKQWFIKTKDMALRAAEAVRMKKMTIDPSNYEELWFDKLDNIRDWCISRQLWWGHRIPAYIIDNGSEKHWIIARNSEEALNLAQKKCNRQNLNVTQDRDVLDTWFSAALLPLSAMRWPDKKYSMNYPLNLMETGHDILFYWVARMTMLCTELVGSIPFDEVLLHGVLCDGQGRKMSKSRGNVILPEFVINGISRNDLDAKSQENCAAGLINKAELKRTLSVNSKNFPEGIPDCGIDALRLTLCSHNIKNDKISFDVIECKTNKHFCNKIWQACRYVLLVTDEKPVEEPQNLSTVDKWILSRMTVMVESVNEAFRQRNFYKAIKAIKQFFYWEFCDVYLEATKPGLQKGSRDVIHGHKYTLIKCLEVSLRILAPVMPYISEELYSRLKNKLGTFRSIPSLMEAPYPNSEEFIYKDEQLEQKFEQILKIVSTIRNILSHINKKSIIEVHIVPDHKENYHLYSDNINLLMATTKIPNIKICFTDEYIAPKDSISTNEGDCRLCYLLDSNDAAAQVKEKLYKKKLQIEKNLEELLKTISVPKHINNSSDEHRIKTENKVRQFFFFLYDNISS